MAGVQPTKAHNVPEYGLEDVFDVVSTLYLHDFGARVNGTCKLFWNNDEVTLMLLKAQKLLSAVCATKDVNPQRLQHCLLLLSRSRELDRCCNEEHLGLRPVDWALHTGNAAALALLLQVPQVNLAVRSTSSYSVEAAFDRLDAVLELYPPGTERHKQLDECRFVWSMCDMYMFRFGFMSALKKAHASDTVNLFQKACELVTKAKGRVMAEPMAACALLIAQTKRTAPSPLSNAGQPGTQHGTDSHEVLLFHPLGTIAAPQTIVSPFQSYSGCSQDVQQLICALEAGLHSVISWWMANGFINAFFYTDRIVSRTDCMEAMETQFHATLLSLQDRSYDPDCFLLLCSHPACLPSTRSKFFSP